MNDVCVLVVDDDPKIRTLLQRCMEGEGFKVDQAADEGEACKRIAQKRYDLITLDINLGSGDGFDVARKVRKTSNVPIIMVSGKDDVIDRIVGLEIGADDYITKPFHVREVVARVRSVLRRSKGLEDTPAQADSDRPTEMNGVHLEIDGLVARLDSFELLDRDGEICDLTSGDFKLLTVFLQNPKRVLSRERIMDLIDGPDYTPMDRTIDNQVARLRKKIERDPARPLLIKTVRGIGYILAADVTTVSS